MTNLWSLNNICLVAKAVRDLNLVLDICSLTMPKTKKDIWNIQSTAVVDFVCKWLSYKKGHDHAKKSK